MRCRDFLASLSFLLIVGVEGWGVRALHLDAACCKAADDLTLQMEFAKSVVAFLTDVDVSSRKWNGSVCVEPLVRVTKVFCVVVSTPETETSLKHNASRLTIA